MLVEISYKTMVPGKIEIILCVFTFEKRQNGVALLSIYQISR